MTETTISLFEKEYVAHVYEMGPDGKLSLWSLFDYFQDIASDHAVKLGFGKDDLEKKNQFWVLSRIYAVIYRLPEWGETVVLRTWPKGTDKVFALRDYEAFTGTGQPVASACSSWLIIDQATKKIRRPDDTLSQFNNGTRKKDSLPRNAGRLDQFADEYPTISNFKVRVSDLDINHHTNNVKYLKWVIDSYNLDFLLNNVPISAEINYLAESRFNENIVVRTSHDKDDGNVFNSSIARLPDNTELCRIRIGWRKNH